MRVFQQELFRAKKKRDKKGRHAGDTGLDDERLEAELSLIQRPHLTDMLPCVVARLVVRVVVGIPSSVRLVIEWYHEWRTVEEESTDESGYQTCFTTAVLDSGFVSPTGASFNSSVSHKHL